jgi:flagellar protein FlaF
VNVYHLAKTAYAAPGGPTRTERATEYALFAEITRKLKNAIDEPQNFPAMAAALHENRRLWSIIATDVADPGNRLPAALRARIFYLAEFTARHSSEVLARKQSAEALVEINTAIMRGLRQQGGAQ